MNADAYGGAYTGIDEDIPPPLTEPNWPHVNSNGDRPGEIGKPDVDAFENAVASKAYLLRIQREAKRRLDDEDNPPVEPPPLEFLDDVLAEPETPIAYRIDAVAPAGSRVILSAQWKAGKTTIVGNLIRALVDVVPFLGRFAVNTPARRVVLIDDELSRQMNREWLRDQHIANTHAVMRCSLRGKVASFDLLDDRCQQWWEQRLVELGCDYLILDCLRPVLDALGLDESRDVGKFLVAFDRLLDEAEIPDAAIVHHMGHTGERARGDSRLEDWPDAIWRMFRENPDDPNSARFFSAFGRDVNVAEGRLGYDPNTRHLTYAGGSRKDSKAEAAYLAVIRLLADSDDPLGVRAIQEQLNPPHPRDAIRKAIKCGVDKDVLAAEKGNNNAKLHRIAHPCTECSLPVITKADRHLSCPSGPEPLPDV
ncbi:MAG TPA: AAA family ATPase [Mycobacterium sp.]|nr:AAA family ATPase [Mycobacterium sp.]